ncbi:hypothetical protein GCM10010383_63890 [Streptomyces lomondensis]|uniref:RNA polymerase sigma-70 region 2 domain-containing protein n=1 Tax=Streptomyces lomondensis TaxID=68229 RepID=A0ABQ2XNT7_9ACTN|nr:hypothetical protein GCM10010383_63890 [Streptomyces lomondensis]
MSETRSDGELLRAVAADADRRAFEELYRRYAPWLRARLRGRCADLSVVDDVVQETFLAVWRGKARYRQEGDSTDAAGWLWRIGSRRLVDALRGDGARGRLRQPWRGCGTGTRRRRRSACSRGWSTGISPGRWCGCRRSCGRCCRRRSSTG